MVTGAGGSIGSEICRQLLSAGASRLYLFGHGENSIYQIDHELRLLQEEGVGEKTSLVPVIGDLRDTDYMNYIMGHLHADVVFHTAAYKHVPMMEENPVAAIENNVLGMENLINTVIRHGAKRFVHISTDKAVEPVSVYGASKMICEQLVMEAARASLSNEAAVTQFMAVRFGNVLGSRGSIVPLFQKQIEKGGPVKVTHSDVRRWFMTIPEACSLVLKTGGVGENGKLYLLDMGEPVRIRDLAEQMIRFYGFEPDTEIKIEYTGLRPGERLDERLWSAEEEPRETEYSRILRVDRKSPYCINLARLMEDIKPVCRYDPQQAQLYRNSNALRAILRAAIPAMCPQASEPTTIYS
jgi:FlaA1/EpsC-like NDP-sugar epimerase